MPELYPFLILPEFHERVWGTRDLRPYFARPVEADPIGEVWLTGEECRVANGPLSGQTLRDLATQYGAELTGEASPHATRFPLLIKFLFPREKLSVQVHPDDARARLVGQPCGKTECWYVARAIDGARVGLGLRPGINREMFRRSIEANQAEHMLNWLDVHTSDMIYVDVGTVHAIGPNANFTWMKACRPSRKKRTPDSSPRNPWRSSRAGKATTRWLHRPASSSKNTR